jgi:hypothetical protein
VLQPPAQIEQITPPRLRDGLRMLDSQELGKIQYLDEEGFRERLNSL